MDKQKNIEIGTRIKDARKKGNLTQSELAKQLSYGSPTVISFIESGERKLKVADLEKIASVLHVTLEFLLSGNTVRTMPTVKTVLRADNDLKPTDIQRIEDFIEALKISRTRRDG
ncbi:MAG: immR 3 [Candidatus Saccharibacteria bacterium]|nr:immR 3 [Candidatus Saccharibacteria bacterium]